MGRPDITAFASLLRPIATEGPCRYLYSYIRADGRDEVFEFLQVLQSKEPGRFAHYLAAFRRLELQGRAPFEKWHMLDPDRVPKGIARDGRSVPLSLKGMGEFKNVPHQSRIFHCNDGALMVLLTVFVRKKEDELTAEAVNPALYAREEYLRRKTELLAKARRQS